jgi:hypothetical protein
MAQYLEVNNHYTITDVVGWPALFQRLQESSGQPIVDTAAVYCYDTSAKGDVAGFYDIRMQSSDEDDHQTFYLVITKGGEPVLNEPMPRLRSAEEMVEMMITLRNHNVLRYSGLDNFYQQWDPLTWLESAAAIREFGDIEAGETLVIPTGHKDSGVGVYTLTKATRDGAVGIEVLMDGAKRFNYPAIVSDHPMKTAEQIVAMILNLRKQYAFGNQFQHNPENAKPLVATVKDGQNEIRLFSNGTITITGPGVMKVVTMADADASKATELMEKILDLTINQ